MATVAPEVGHGRWRRWAASGSLALLVGTVVALTGLAGAAAADETPPTIPALPSADGPAGEASDAEEPVARPNRMEAPTLEAPAEADRRAGAGMAIDDGRPDPVLAVPGNLVADGGSNDLSRVGDERQEAPKRRRPVDIDTSPTTGADPVVTDPAPTNADAVATDTAPTDAVAVDTALTDPAPVAVVRPPAGPGTSAPPPSTVGPVVAGPVSLPLPPLLVVDTAATAFPPGRIPAGSGDLLEITVRRQQPVPGMRASEARPSALAVESWAGIGERLADSDQASAERPPAISTASPTGPSRRLAPANQLEAGSMAASAMAIVVLLPTAVLLARRVGNGRGRRLGASVRSATVRCNTVMGAVSGAGPPVTLIDPRRSALPAPWAQLSPSSPDRVARATVLPRSPAVAASPKHRFLLVPISPVPPSEHGCAGGPAGRAGPLPLSRRVAAASVERSLLAPDRRPATGYVPGGERGPPRIGEGRHRSSCGGQSTRLTASRRNRSHDTTANCGAVPLEQAVRR